jgi:hypothetical protein
MLALLAVAVLAPLLYIPGYLLALALLGAHQPADPLERAYERVVAGALLNGWLALTLAELGIFAAWLHLLLVLAVCAVCALFAWRRGALPLPRQPLGIVAGGRAAFVQPLGRKTKDQGPNSDASFVVGRWSLVRRLAARWELIGFAAIGLLFAVLVARPFEVVLGARDAGVYATSGFAIARYGGIAQDDALVRQIALDQQSPDPALRAAAEQAETNLLGVQPASRLVATRLRYSGYLINQGDMERGRVVPQFFHLYPAWIGLLTSLLGLRGGLLATSLMGFLGVWGVGMLGRRLAGPWVGLLGALFLALNGAQVWFSRYSTSEACAQFLSFAALYAFAVMHERGREAQDAGASGRAGEGVQTRDRRHATGDTDSSLTSHVSRLTSHAWFAGLLAGAAAGQLALTRIDFFVIVAPLLLYLLYIALVRRWSVAHWALAGGLGAMLLHAALHIVFISRAYFLDTLYARLQDKSAIVANIAYLLWTPALRQQFLDIPRAAPLRSPLRLWAEIGLVAVLVVGFVVLRRAGRPQRWLEGVVLRYRRGLAAVCALAVVLLGVYGYLIRPQILTGATLAAAPGCLAPAQLRAPSGACLALQGYIGAPIENPEHPNQVAYLLGTLPKWLRGQELQPPSATSFSFGNPGESEKIGIAQANLVRVGWYLSPLGVILGIAGFALWCWRGMNRASWLFLAASLVSTIFFVRLAYGTSDLTYIYILRRYVPLTYPAFSLGMAYAIVALARRWTNDQRPTTKGRHLASLVVRLSSFVVALALLGFFVATNRQLYAHVEYQGAVDQLAAIAGRFGPDDVLLFRGEARDTPDLVATPLKYGFGLNTFAIRSPDPGQYAGDLANYVLRCQAQGRQVYLVLGANGAVALPGLRPEPVAPLSLHLPEFQQLRDQKPSGTQEFAFDFRVYRLAPADPAAPAAPATVAVDDFTAQLRGFYRPEQIGGAAIAWTNGDALLRLPWPRAGDSSTLTINLAPGATRPAALGPARACLAYLPEQSFALTNAPFLGEQCFELGAGMRGSQLAIDTAGLPAPKTGTLLLRITSPRWVPAAADPAQHDQRELGVQFGGAAVGR